MLDIRVLKIVSIEEDEKMNRTITLAPPELRYIVVYANDPKHIRDEEFKFCQIVFNDESVLDVTLSDIDIDRIETLIGGYGVPMD